MKFLIVVKKKQSEVIVNKCCKLVYLGCKTFEFIVLFVAVLAEEKTVQKYIFLPLVAVNRLTLIYNY
jgi:hypothetical protein